jgi:hypothetical protein
LTEVCCCGKAATAVSQGSCQSSTLALLERGLALLQERSHAFALVWCAKATVKQPPAHRRQLTAEQNLGVLFMSLHQSRVGTQAWPFPSIERTPYAAAHARAHTAVEAEHTYQCSKSRHAQPLLASAVVVASPPHVVVCGPNTCCHTHLSNSKPASMGMVSAASAACSTLATAPAGRLQTPHNNRQPKAADGASQSLAAADGSSYEHSTHPPSRLADFHAVLRLWLPA